MSDTLQLPVVQSALFVWLQQQTGLYITVANKDPVLLALKVLANESKESEANYASLLISGQINPQPFFDATTTHESFFLRHKEHMQTAINEVIRPLIKKGIRPRVLSAPCAQGEEPYSFAMLLQDSGINPSKVEIVATDIAHSSIIAAKNAEYRPYSLRQAPKNFISLHFQHQNGVYRPFPTIKNAVKFIQLNLLTESLARLAPGFHVIFSHNMLIYFNRSTVVQMVGIFDKLLDKQGMLFVDNTEVPHVSEVLPSKIFQGHIRGFCKRDNSATPKPIIPQPYVANHSNQTNQKNKINSPPVDNSKKIIEKEHNEAESKRYAAEDAYNKKRFGEAIYIYEQLIDKHPSWACWAKVGKAQVLLDSGEELEALEVAESALASKIGAKHNLTKKDEATAHAIIALVLHNKGMHNKIKQHTDAIKRLEPNHEVLRLFR